jgi:hypothetical protein
VKEFWSFIILLLFLQMCFSKGQISTEKKEDRKWDTSYPWNAWRDVSMPFDCTSERSISTVVVLGNTVAGTATSDSPPEPSLKLSGNPPSKLVMAVGSCTRISSICRGLIKKEKQKQTAVCLFACDEENVTFGVLIKELYSRGKKNASSMQLNKTKTRNQLPAATQ